VPERSEPTARPLRVLFVIGSLDGGGSEGQLVELLARAHPGRVLASLVTLHPSEHPGHSARVAAMGIDHRVLTPASGPRPVRVATATRNLGAAMRRTRPDVVYAWLEESGLLAGPVAHALGIPIVVARRNVAGAYAERSKAVGTAIRRAERLAAIVTANSPAVVEAAVRRGIAPERLRLVPNGHPCAAPLPLPGGSTVRLGYLARMRPEKGHRRLLSVLAALPADLDWRMELGGDGPLTSEVRAEAGRLGLAGRIAFSGRVDDARAFWARQSVAVLLSDHEGCPNALIEAAMAGRPIVATDVGGTPEVVAPSGGVLVDPARPDLAAAALRRFAGDPDLCRRTGAAAHAQAVERFSGERATEDHLRALAEAADMREAAPAEAVTGERRPRLPSRRALARARL